MGRRKKEKENPLLRVKEFATKYKEQRNLLLNTDSFFWQHHSSMECSIRMIINYGKQYRWEKEYAQIKKEVGIVD